MTLSIVSTEKPDRYPPYVCGGPIPRRPWDYPKPYPDPTLDPEKIKKELKVFGEALKKIIKNGGIILLPMIKRKPPIYPEGHPGNKEKAIYC